MPGRRHTPRLWRLVREEEAAWEHERVLVAVLDRDRKVTAAYGYLIQGTLDRQQATRIAEELLADRVVQETVVAPPSVVVWRNRRPDIFGPLSSFGRQSYPTGIETVAKLPNLTQGLFDRGYDHEATAAILGGNWLRTFRAFCG